MTIRTDIRAALAARVKAAVPALRDAYPSRPFNVAPEDLPLAFCYFTEGGDAEYSLDDEGEQAQLMVSLYVMETNQADADLDVLAEQLDGLTGDDLGGLLREALPSPSWQYGIDEQSTGLASITLNFNAIWSK
ncbi:phage tail terminator protein [Aeromonas hydrophila]